MRSRAPMTLSSVALQILTGLASRVGAVPRCQRAVADLRRDADRQLRARLVLHARHVRRPIALATALRAPAPFGFWGAVLLAALVVAVLGALIEMLVLRRIYAAPELFQLLATFALVLIIRDAALWPGARKTSSARARRAWRARSNPRPALSELRRAAHRRRPGACSACSGCC